jgi:hypothetical protein
LTITRENCPVQAASLPMYALTATTLSLKATSGQLSPVHAATWVAPEARPTWTRKFVLRALTPCIRGWPASCVPSVTGSAEISGE